MTMDRELDRALDLWFEGGPTEIADRVVMSALDTIERTPQARPRLRLTRRFVMHHPLRLAAASAAAFIVVAVAAGLLLNQSAPPPVSASPTPHAVVPPSPSAATSSPAPESTDSPTTAPPAARTPLIAYVHRDTDPATGAPTYKWHAYTVEPDGSNRRQLNADLSLDVTTLAWSDDGSRVLAYAPGYPQVEPATNPGIYAFDVATGQARQVTSCVAPCARDTDPQLSTDGRTLLFVRHSGQTDAGFTDSVIASVDLTTGTTTEIEGTHLDQTPRPCGNRGASCRGPWSRAPQLSPDGRFIAFARMEDVADDGAGVPRGATAERGDIVVMNADGSNQHQLNLGGLSASDPQWSADGTQLLIGSYRQDYIVDIQHGLRDTLRLRRDIYAVSPDGRVRNRLTRDGASAGATWTSDGQVRFIRWDRDGPASEDNPNFWVMNADGSDARQLTQLDAGDWTWSTISLAHPIARWQP